MAKTSFLPPGFSGFRLSAPLFCYAKQRLRRPYNPSRKDFIVRTFDENWRIDGILRFPLRLLDEIIIPDFETNDSKPYIIVFENRKFYLWGKKEFVKKLDSQKQFSFPTFIIIRNKDEVVLGKLKNRSTEHILYLAIRFTFFGVSVNFRPLDRPSKYLEEHKV